MFATIGGDSRSRGVIRITAALAALAIVAAACSPDSDDSDAASAAAARAEFGSAVVAIGEEFVPFDEELFADLGPIFARSGEEAAIAALPDYLPAELEAIDRAIDQLDALTTPEEFRADRATHLAALRDIRATRADQLAAAEAGDTSGVIELDNELRRAARALVSSVSNDYRELIVLPEFFGDTAEVFGELTTAETEYLDGLEAAQREFAARNEEFARNVGASYGSIDEQLQALIDAGAGTGFAAVYDVVRALEPPPSFEADHEAVLDMLGIQVAIDANILAAAEAGDFASFLVLNHRLGLANLAMLDVDPAVRTVVTGPFPTFDSTMLSDAEYASAVHEALVPLGLAWSGGLGFYDFHPLSTVELHAEIVSRLSAETTAIIVGAADDITALDPPAEARSDHQSLVAWLGEIVATHDEAITVADSGDGEATDLALEAMIDVYCSAPDFSSDFDPLVLPFRGRGEAPDGPCAAA